MNRRASWVTAVLILTLLAFGTNAWAANGPGSFLYHRYGASITPTWKFWYVDGTTSNVTSLASDDLPTLSRRFAPAQGATSLTQFKSTNNYWVVDAKWSWNYNIGTAFSDFIANKPLSGENFFLTESHVSRGWLWKAYYTTMPGTIKTHLFDNAIYKENHVECDIWTTSPNLFAGSTQYHTQWMFDPESGKDFASLPKTFGHAHVITIYRWWNAIHVASGHGDPMDKISWRDDLGTFGSNVSASGASAIETVAAEDGFTVLARGEKLMLSRTIRSTTDLDGYVSSRSSILRQLDPHAHIVATVSVTGLDAAAAARLAHDHGCAVEYFGFRTNAGSGAAHVTASDLPAMVSIVERAFTISIEEIDLLVVRGEAGDLVRLTAHDSVQLVDPAVHLTQQGNVIETTPPDPIGGEIRELSL